MINKTNITHNRNNTKNSQNTNYIINIYIITTSILAFTGSLFFEHILQYQPCILCLIERYAFAITFLLSCSIQFLQSRYLQYSQPLTNLQNLQYHKYAYPHLFCSLLQATLNVIIFLVVGCFIYHILVEFHIIGDELCKSFSLPANIDVDNLETFLKQQQNVTNLAPCSQKSPTIFYIPLTFIGLSLHLSYLIIQLFAQHNTTHCIKISTKKLSGKKSKNHQSKIKNI